MRFLWTTIAAATLLALTGCIQDLIDQGAGLAPDTDTSGPLSTGEPVIPTTGVQTVTGADDGPEPASTSTGVPNAPPTIELFAVTPSVTMTEAGQVELFLQASDDVVKVLLSLDGTDLAELSPRDFPYPWHALSAKDNGWKRKFRVIVQDEGGLMAEAEAELDIQLPASGAQRCLFEADKNVASVAVALKYTPDAIVVVGTQMAAGGTRMIAWKLHPDEGCHVLPGWPQTFDDWNGDDTLKGLPSSGAAVDVDDKGYIVVAGNLDVAGKLQSFVARLNPDGSRVWQRAGAIGDEVTGVAVARDPYADRVFVVGSRRTGDQPVCTDGTISVYYPGANEVLSTEPVLLRAPLTAGEMDDLMNYRSEFVRAVVVDPTTGEALAVGEREYTSNGFDIYIRAFTARVNPLGEPSGEPWTSVAPAFKHDAVRSVGLCGDDFVVGGWTRDIEPGAKPQPIMFWLLASQHRHLPQLGTVQIDGIACDKESKVISAGTQSSFPFNAQVFSVTGTSDTPNWYETGQDDSDSASAVACDHRGFCGWAGFRTANGKPYAVVRVHHP